MSTSYLCVCGDWRINMRILNAPFVSAWARNPLAGQGYTGKKFAFCPWCGLSLRVETNAVDLERSPAKTDAEKLAAVWAKAREHGEVFYLWRNAVEECATALGITLEGREEKC